MEKIKLPKKLKIGCMDYTVLFPYNFIDMDYVGLHTSYSSLIRVTDTIDGKKRKNDSILESFIHEITHAVDLVYNNDILDEKTVALYARAWLQILKDNELYLREKKIPKKIKVGCFYYKIDYPYEFVEAETSLVARITNNELIIKLTGFSGTEEHSKEFIKSCMIFGLNHAISNVYFDYNNGNGDREMIQNIKTSSIANGWYQVLRDNGIDKLVKKYGELK